MASNSALVVSDLDFGTIRDNLSIYLASQTQFKDYDFEGSNLSVLLDVLAYNTYMNNFYTNMAISEMFLDSAQIRDSIVSRAKELNYTPRSYRSATAYVDITITPGDSPASIVIPRGAAFNSRIDNNIYTFTTDAPIIVTAAENYTVSNTAIYEGTYVIESYLVNTSNTSQRFIINNTSVDTSSIEVSVQNSSTDTTNTAFIQAVSLLGSTSTSKIFFVQAADKNRYELVFGDGIASAAVNNGNIINVTYRTAVGTPANKAATFKAASTIAGYAAANIAVTTAIAAYGGADPESFRSIKFNAPRHYQTQERAVTNDDYRTILLAKYPDIRSVNVYGGETVYPPQYGKVFISVDFNSFDGIPAVIKDDIQAYLVAKMPISIEPSVVSPEYTYIDVIASVSYNINTSTKTLTAIQNLVIDAVTQYNTDYLDDFKIKFRQSKLAAAIDGADFSIVSSNLITRLIKNISPVIDTAESFSLTYLNQLTISTLISSTFTYANVNAFLKEDGAGVINIVTLYNNVESIVAPSVGTINYTTGAVTIKMPAITAYIGDSIKVYAQAAIQDFSVINNTILSIIPEDISVTVTAVRE